MWRIYYYKVPANSPLHCLASIRLPQDRQLAVTLTYSHFKKLSFFNGQTERNVAFVYRLVRIVAKPRVILAFSVKLVNGFFIKSSPSLFLNTSKKNFIVVSGHRSTRSIYCYWCQAIYIFLYTLLVASYKLLFVYCQLSVQLFCFGFHYYYYILLYIAAFELVVLKLIYIIIILYVHNKVIIL